MDYKEEIEELFYGFPPKWDVIRKKLDERPLSGFEVAEVAIDLADRCNGEYGRAMDPDIKGYTPDRMHSTYLLDSLKLLLEYGLDPNTMIYIYDDNILVALTYVDAPNVGAAALRLMLEHGGDPNIGSDDYESDRLFYAHTSAIEYEKYENEYSVQCWWLLMAYGARWPDGSLPLTMLNGNKVEMLKDFERFDYTIEFHSNPGNYYGNWTMHIFDKTTGEEVARYC